MTAAATLAPTRLPHPALRALVTVYRGYRYDAFPTSVHHGLPGAEMPMVLAFGAPLDVGPLGDEAGRIRHRFLVSGRPDRCGVTGCSHG